MLLRIIANGSIQRCRKELPPMSKLFATLEELQAWLNSPDRGEYQIEYIIKEGSAYIVMLHPIRKAA